MSEEIGSRTEDNSGKWWRYVLIGLDSAIGVGFATWAGLCIYLTWFKKKKVN